jgi:hypothetical protein
MLNVGHQLSGWQLRWRPDSIISGSIRETLNPTLTLNKVQLLVDLSCMRHILVSVRIWGRTSCMGATPTAGGVANPPFWVRFGSVFGRFSTIFIYFLGTVGGGAPL